MSAPSYPTPRSSERDREGRERYRPAGWTLGDGVLSEDGLGYRGVRRRGFVISERTGQLSEALHRLLVSLDGRLDGLKIKHTTRAQGPDRALHPSRGAEEPRLRTCIQSFFSSSVLRKQRQKIRRGKREAAALACRSACACSDLACSSRDLCFPDTRKVLGTAALLVSLSWRLKGERVLLWAGLISGGGPITGRSLTSIPSTSMRARTPYF